MENIKYDIKLEDISDDVRVKDEFNNDDDELQDLINRTRDHEAMIKQEFNEDVKKDTIAKDDTVDQEPSTFIEKADSIKWNPL